MSRDLIDWRHLPIALHPDEDGAIFSAVVRDLVVYRLEPSPKQVGEQLIS